jgi:hypothetical protein
LLPLLRQDSFKDIKSYKIIIITMYCYTCNIDRYNIENNNTTKKGELEYSYIVVFLHLARISKYKYEPDSDKLGHIR